jgi:TetR/AcrR family transcriptional repressor of nem operon
MPRTKAFNENEALEKALQLFWKQGYHATSVQDLVDHLSINRASLYDTFGGKKELFERAFDQYIQSNTAQMRSFLRQQSNVRSGLRKLFVNTIQESVNDPNRKGCFVVNTTTELVPNDPDIIQTLEKNRHRFESLFLDYLRMGQEKREIPPGKDLPAIARLLFTLYNGLKVVAKTHPTEEDQLASVDALLTILD